MGFNDMITSDIANQIDLVPLATRRKYSAYKLIIDIIYCTKLLSKIGLRVQGIFDSKIKTNFHVPFRSKPYVNNSPMLLA